MADSGDLRPYQEDALEAIRESEQSHKSLVMPTGSGKTRVALKYAQELMEEGPSVAYVASTNAHAEQVIREAKAVNVEAAHIKGASAHESMENSTGPSRERLIEDFDLGLHVGVFSYKGYFLGGSVRSANTVIIDDAHEVVGQELSHSAVEIDKGEWGRQFDDVLDLLKEENPLLSDQIDGLEYPVHREGDAVLIPPPSTGDAAQALKNKLDTLSSGTGYKRRLLRNRLSASPEFVNWPCVVTRYSICWRPFVLPFESFGQAQDNDRSEDEVLLLTSTKDSAEFLQYRLGIAQSVHQVNSDQESEEMGSRLVLSYPDLGSYSPPSEAQVKIIEKWAHQFGSVLVSMSSNDTYAELSERLSTDIAKLRYQSDESIDEFDSLEEPRILMLVNRPSGIDIHSQICNVGIHLDLPYSTSGHESIAGGFKMPGVVAEASLAVRLSQLLGRLNRHPDDRSAHLILAGGLPLARGSVFVKSLDPAVLLDILIGRRGIKPDYELPVQDRLVEDIQSFLDGDDEFRDRHEESQRRARSRYLQGGSDRFNPDPNQVIEGNLLESRGNFAEAARKFESLARDAARDGYPAEASFFDFQALCCSAADDVDAQEVFGRSEDALIERALERNPSHNELVAALRQAQLGSETDAEESKRQLTQMDLRREAYIHYSHNIDSFEDDLPDEDLSSPDTWRDYWRNQLTAADHEDLLDSYIEIFQLLGTDTPHREIKNNDASIQWKIAPGRRFTIALEVKGWNDDLRDSPSELKNDDLEQARENAENIDADAVLLVSSRQGYERGVPRKAEQLDVSFITHHAAIALADLLAEHCATLHRIDSGAGGMDDIEIDALFISSILQKGSGVEIDPSRIRELE